MTDQRRSRRTFARRIVPASRVDMGALEQRVFSTEKSIGELSEQTTRQIAGLRTDITNVAAELGDKIDEQAKAFAAAGRTDWLAFFSAAGVTLSIITIMGYLTISPINTEIQRFESDMRNVEAQSASRDDLRDVVNYGGSRLDRLDDALAKLRDEAVTKGEERDAHASSSEQMKAIWERLDALSDRAAPTK